METFSETKFLLFKLPDLQRTISEIGYIVRAITNNVRTVTTVLKSTCRRFCKSVISRVPHYNYSLPAYGMQPLFCAVIIFSFPYKLNKFQFQLIHMLKFWKDLSQGLQGEWTDYISNSNKNDTFVVYRTIGVYFFIQ